MAKPELPKCYSCSLFHLKGTGYSDWTWTSTWAVCLKDRFEEFPEGDHSDMGVMEAAAENCPFYKEGEPLETSPDYDCKQEVKERLKNV